MDRKETLDWLNIIKTNFKNFPEISNEKKIEAVKTAMELIEQIPKLQNRCFALTDGTMCQFCPYVCDNRSSD